MTRSSLEYIPWLFYSSSTKNSAISSSATFSPVHAANSDQAWQSTTRPSAQRNKKTLILTRDFFQGEIADFFAIIEWLRCAGFEMRLCIKDPNTQQNIFPPFQGNIDIARLSQLTPFHAKTDYNTLAQEVSYDHVAVLDQQMFSQLTKCLDKKQRVLGETAISTATTLKFYHVPEETTNGFLLAQRIAEKTEEEALLLIDQYIKKEYSLSFSDFIDCLKSYPTELVAEKLHQIYGRVNNINLNYFLQACPTTAKRLLLQYVEDIKNGENLSYFLKTFPEEAKALLKAHGHKIENGWQLAHCLKACPTEEKTLLQIHEDKIENGLQLAHCLEACSAERERLLQTHGHKIKGSELAHCIKAFPTAAKMLLQTHGHKIGDAVDLSACLAICPCPIEAERLLYAHADKITDGWELSGCVAACPTKARTLLQTHGHKIQNGEQLIECLKYCPTETKMLMQLYGNTILDGYDLAAHCMAYPKKAKQYIQEHGKKIADEYQFAACLEACPAEAEMLTHIYTSDANKNFDIYTCADKWPAGLSLLLKKCAKPISSKLLTYHIPELSSLERYFSPQTLDRLYKNKNTISIADQETIENVTCIYIGSISENRANAIISYLQKQTLPNLSLIEVAHCATDDIPHLERILDVLQAKTPHLLLPRSLQNKEIGRGKKYTYSYTAHEKYIVEGDEKNVPSFAPSILQKTYSQKLHVASNGLSPQFETRNVEKYTFNMLHAGEIINGNIFQPPPRLRTGIIDLDLENFTQSYVQPDVLKDEEIPYLEEKEFEQCVQEKSHATDSTYAKFTQTILAGQTTRLLSLDAAEHLIAMHYAQSHTKNKVQIQKGKDGFYYATATETCDLQYLVKANPIVLEQFDLQDPIQAILHAYKTNPKYRENVDASYAVPPMGQDPDTWWEELYQTCAGSCRHRTGAVYAKILRSLGQNIKEKIRIVAVDNNHTRLEILEADRWIQVDLGGVETALCYSAQQTYTAALDPKHAISPRKIEHNITPKESAKTYLHNPNPNPKHIFSSTKAQDNITPKEEVKIHLNNPTQDNHTALPDPPDFLVLTKIQPHPTPKNTQKTEEKHTPEAEAILKEEREKYAPKMLFTPGDMLEKTIHHTRHRKILCITENAKMIDAQAHFLLQQADAQKRAVFYIDHPRKIDIGIEQILINSSSEPELARKSLLQDFFTQAKKAAHPPLLLINWETFDPKKRLQLNTLLEKKGSICGISVPANIQIIGLCTETPKDCSFISQHAAFLDTTEVTPPPLFSDLPSDPASAQPEKITIDLEGISNWEEKLFGKITQTKTGIYWKKSDFVTALEEKKKYRTFDIINASNPNACAYTLQQARALGKFSYHGHEIAYPKETEVHCNTSPFDFSIFSPAYVKTDVQKYHVHADIYIVHTDRFDFLLTEKEIKNLTYQEIFGCIEKHAGETVQLYITSSLTEAQWYSLFCNAEKHGVKLALLLAPKVTLPVNIKQEALALEEKEVAAAQIKNAVYITLHVDLLEKAIRDLALYVPTQVPLVLHVEDYDFSDLVYQLHFDKKNSQFENFRIEKSAVLQALIDGRDVILRGAFSDSLLAELQSLLLGQSLLLPNGESITPKGKLICLIEPSTNQKLDWLTPPLLGDPSTIAASHAASCSTFKSKNIIYDESQYTSSHTIDLENTAKKADAFIRARKKAIIDALQHNNLLQIISKSGTGKSRILAEMKSKGICKVYNELSSFEEWANDTSKKIKILFIDESNIEDTHFTRFAPLKPGGTREILHKGKLYKLDPFHKVIFACNPTHYGGGRKEQKLFEDGSIPEMHFADFPDAYVYEKMMKPLLLNSGMQEAECLAFSKSLIAFYKKNNEGNKKYTVRELQEEILQTCQHSKARKEAEDIKEEETEAQDTFCITSNNKDLLSRLDTFIAIRKEAREKNYDLGGIGLNGVLLEGKSATGKKEAVRYALKKAGYHLIENETDIAEKYAFVCYKIATSLSLEKKEEIIIKAFEEGNAIWIDKFNGCIDDGLEKILNAVLTGEHPRTKKKAIRSGFMAFFTTHSAAVSGGDLIGPALCHRCHLLHTFDHQLDDIRIIFAEKFPHISKTKREKMAQEFILLQTEGENLRSYLEKIEEKTKAPFPTFSFLHANPYPLGAQKSGVFCPVY